MSTAIFSEAPVEPMTPMLALPPSVSVIIPCYNEERFIGTALANLADQYAPENYEIIVVDGMSEDGTREAVVAFQELHPELSIRVLNNPARNIPTALNLGVEAARGEIIARMDAHAAPSAGYIRRCVEVLGEDIAVVGMPCRVRPGADTVMARAIALAVSHPFGIGDAKYRLTSDNEASQEDVDTVAFACFKKSLWMELGGFNEQLLTNEDYDFNYRARSHGKRVVLDRAAYCEYFARPTLAKLSSQYLRYGLWKARMVRASPRSMKWRHMVAPAFVASFLLLLSASFISRLALYLLAAELSIYAAAALGFAFQAARRQKLAVMLMLPLTFMTIHFSWGGSFLLGLLAAGNGRHSINK